MNFANQTIILTGAAGGMGQAIARRFGAAGAKIALLDRDEAALKETAAQLKEEGISNWPCVCDVTDAEQCTLAINQTVSRFGGVDILVNNAGITHRSAFAETELAVFRRVMEVNYFGSLYCAHAALPHLLKSKGSIVIISSISGFSPLLGRSGYSASKYALHGLFESLRSEVAPKGVHIMMVCPGFTDTNINKNALAGDGQLNQHPRSTTGKIYSPETVADAILEGLRKKKRTLVLSPIGKLAYAISRIFPGFYEKRMAMKLRHEIER